MKKILFMIMVFTFHLWAKDTLVVVKPIGKQFNEVFLGIEGELEEDFVIHVIDLSKDADADAQKIEAISPKGIVLMDNASLKVIRIFQGRESNRNIPVFATMMLRVEESCKGIANITGVKFEIPAYTIFSHLKYISKTKIDNIVVFHRKKFQTVIENAKRMIKKENITLEEYCVDCSSNWNPERVYKSLQSNYKKAKKKKNLDLIWILADNALLNTKTMNKFWLPQIASKRIAVVAPLENLVEPKWNFGLIAFQPDYSELGTQVSDIIRRVLSEEEATQNIGFEELISVYSVVNTRKARKIGWKMHTKKLQSRVKRILD